MHRTLLSLAAVGVASTALAACGSSSGSSGHRMVSTLKPVIAGGPSGRFTLTQDGDELTAAWDVSGLTPGPHASHVHGPSGACSPASKRKAGMAVVLPDVVADFSGHAAGRAKVVVHQDVLRSGFYVQVHRDATPGEFSALTSSGTEVTATAMSTMGSGSASGSMGGLMRVMDRDPAVGCAQL